MNHLLSESPIDIQEFIDSNVKLSFTPMAPLIEDAVIKNIQLPWISEESPLPVKEMLKKDLEVMQKKVEFH